MIDLYKQKKILNDEITLETLDEDTNEENISEECRNVNLIEEYFNRGFANVYGDHQSANQRCVVLDSDTIDFESVWGSDDAQEKSFQVRLIHVIILKLLV